MNNKGFAITTIIYGTLVLFLMLLISMLAILSAYKDRLEILVEGNNAARDIIMSKNNSKNPEEDEEEEADVDMNNEVYCSIYTYSTNSVHIYRTTAKECTTECVEEGLTCDTFMQTQTGVGEFVNYVFTDATSCTVSGIELTWNLKNAGCVEA